MAKGTGRDEAQGPSTGTLLKLSAEIELARAKFPNNEHLLAALVEEVGELAEAYLKKKPTSEVRAEALQVACVALRIYEEGDASFDGWDGESIGCGNCSFTGKTEHGPCLCQSCRDSLAGQASEICGRKYKQGESSDVSLLLPYCTSCGENNEDCTCPCIPIINTATNELAVTYAHSEDLKTHCDVCANEIVKCTCDPPCYMVK